MSHFEIDNGICPPLANNFHEGRRCDCSDAPGWTENGGWMMYCSHRECYSKQEFEYCIGKEWSNGTLPQVGDGTWCEDDKRHTKCRIVKEKGKNIFIPLIKMRVSDVLNIGWTLSW